MQWPGESLAQPSNLFDQLLQGEDSDLTRFLSRFADPTGAALSVREDTARNVRGDRVAGCKRMSPVASRTPVRPTFQDSPLGGGWDGPRTVPAQMPR